MTFRRAILCAGLGLLTVSAARHVNAATGEVSATGYGGESTGGWICGPVGPMRYGGAAVDVPAGRGARDREGAAHGRAVQPGGGSGRERGDDGSLDQHDELRLPRAEPTRQPSTPPTNPTREPERAARGPSVTSAPQERGVWGRSRPHRDPRRSARARGLGPLAAPS